MLVDIMGVALREFVRASGILVFVSYPILAGLVSPAKADCECGYALPGDRDNFGHVFTDLLESDFVHVGKVNEDAGWLPQEFNVTAHTARGVFGQSFVVDNVVTNPINDRKSWSGPGRSGGDAGLHFVVENAPNDDMVRGAEIATDRLDLSYGSYRAGIKITNVPGTCSAFFWVSPL